MLYAENMWKAGNRCELRVFQIGNHGLALGYGRKDVAEWPRLAKEFLIHNAGFRFPETPVSRTVVLTFDDATKNQMTFVAPLLKKYGFGATFFPCNFDAKWRKKYANTLMDKDDLKALQDMGFEIGNHTDNHKVMTGLEKAECKKEIDSFAQYLESVL